MKVALIGDVHANLPALEAVLAHILSQGVITTWNLGDFVGYGAFPEQVVECLQHEGIVSIIGNYDLKVLRFPRKTAKWEKSKHSTKFIAFRWAYENLSEESLAYLSTLPREIHLDVKGWNVLLTHGSPASNEEHLTPDTSKERLKELAQITNANIILCGHSHQPFTRRVGGVWFINPGSVGRPDDGDPRASYAILHIEPHKIDVVHYRLEYDLDRAVTAIYENNLPDAFAHMILQGYDLDTILEKM